MWLSASAYICMYRLVGSSDSIELRIVYCCRPRQIHALAKVRIIAIKVGLWLRSDEKPIIAIYRIFLSRPRLK